MVDNENECNNNSLKEGTDSEYNLDLSMENLSSFYENDDIFSPSESSLNITSDELPIFSIRTLSPNGRSISPIDSEPDDFFFSDYSSPEISVSPDDPSMISISIEEMHAQITTPKNSRYGRNLNLETIFEDQFLETPPKRFKTEHISLDVESRRVIFNSNDDQEENVYSNNLEEQALIQNFLKNIKLNNN